MSVALARNCMRASIIMMFAIAGASPVLAQDLTQDKKLPIDVVVDQAKLVKVPEQVATIVVGNPLIADVALQPGGTMVVTGKGYGTTNLIVMDRSGAILEERTILVEGSSHRLVTVFRGIDRETYSCTPVCQRRVTLGDGPTYFNATLNQGGTLTQRATMAGTTAGQQRR